MSDMKPDTKKERAAKYQKGARKAIANKIVVHINATSTGFMAAPPTEIGNKSAIQVKCELETGIAYIVITVQECIVS